MRKRVNVCLCRERNECSEKMVEWLDLISTMYVVRICMCVWYTTLSIAVLCVWVVYKQNQRRCYSAFVEYCCAEDFPMIKLKGCNARGLKRERREIMRTYLANTPHRRCIHTQICVMCML